MDRAWTLTCLATVQMLIAARAPLRSVAFALARSEHEINRATTALEGRTIEGARAHLNRPVPLHNRVQG